MRGGGRGAWGLASGPTLSHSCRARPEARHCSQGPLGAPLVLESDVLRGVHRARGGSNQSPWRGQGRRNPLALLPGRTACSSTCGQRNQVNHRLYSETDGCGCLRSLLTWASRSLPALSSVEMASLQGGRQFEADLGSHQRLGMHTLTLGDSASLWAVWVPQPGPTVGAGDLPLSPMGLQQTLQRKAHPGMEGSSARLHVRRAKQCGFWNQSRSTEAPAPLPLLHQWCKLRPEADGRGLSPRSLDSELPHAV